MGACGVAIARGGTLIMLSSKAWSLHSPRTLAPFFSTPSFCPTTLLRIGKPSWRSSSFSNPRRRFFRASLEAEAEAGAGAGAGTSTVADATLSSTSTVDSADGALSSSPSVPSADSIMDAANALDIKVGRILRAWRHPEADALYVEEVDVGETEPRTICSGLVKFVPLDELQDVKVVVLANLKPRNMRGVKSSGMLLAASDVSHENVELLLPPEGSVPGERIWFGSEEEKDHQSAAATPNQVQKKKIWELVQPHLKTDDSCVAALGVHPMRTSAGVVVCKSLQNANIS